MKFRSIFPKIELKHIKAFERESGFLLPEDYKQFLLDTNGFFSTDFYAKSKFSDEIRQVTKLFGLYEQSLQKGVNATVYGEVQSKHSDLLYNYSALHLVNEHPECIICIGSSMMIDVLMSLDREHYGRIYCGHPQEGEEQLYDEERAESTSIEKELIYVGFRPFANNFTEFLNSSVSEAEYEASLL